MSSLLGFRLLVLTFASFFFLQTPVSMLHIGILFCVPFSFYFSFFLQVPFVDVLSFVLFLFRTSSARYVFSSLAERHAATRLHCKRGGVIRENVCAKMNGVSPLRRGRALCLGLETRALFFLGRAKERRRRKRKKQTNWAK